MMTRGKPYPVIMLGSVFILSGAGAWISGQLVKEHAGRWAAGGSGGGLFARVCEVAQGAGFNCAGAVKGPWSEIKVPIPVPSRDLTIGVRTVVVPVAFLGLAYFVFMGVWFAFVGRPRVYGYRWHRVPLVLGLCGAAVSTSYLGVMALGLAPWCVWCLAVHLINFLMVLAIWRLGAGRRFCESTPAVADLDYEPEKMSRATITLREATTAIALSLILITGLWVYRHEHLAFRRKLQSLMPYKHIVTSLQEDPAFLLREYHAQPQHQIPLRSGEPSDSGQPQLVVFTDFECPACYCNSLAVRNQIAAAFMEHLTVMVRHYPLDNACNENIENELHSNACEAAYAAEAARLQGGGKAFGRMHTLLFKNRKRLGDKLYRDLAAHIGLDPDRFESDMKSDVVRQTVQSDIKLAEELGVAGTPTMLLNGRLVPKLCQGPVFWEAFAETWTRSAQDRFGADSGSPDVLAATDAARNGRE